MAWCRLVIFTLCFNLAVCSILPLHAASPEYGEATTIESRQAPGVISNENFVRRAWHASAVAGKYLYIDGGEFSYKSGNNEITPQYSSTTLSIDLSQDWTNDSVVIRTTSKPPGAPILTHPAFAYDESNDIFYSGWAGRASGFADSPEPPPVALWSFKPDGTGGGAWNREIGNSDPAFDHLTRSLNGYQTYGGDRALVLGGISTSQTSPATSQIEDDVLLPGLVELNMATKTFTNSSARAFNNGQVGVQGQMHYVPAFGPNGIFLMMGGSSFPADDNNLISLSNIWAYEPVTDEWFNQTATGNIPEKRKDFCTAGVNSTNGTYEIFLYAGVNGNLGPEAIPYDEIFILTLPAFRWLKVDYPPQHPRHGHTCNAVGGSQILSVGGADSNPRIYINAYYDEIEESTFNTTVDPFVQGLGVFDMTTLKWADHYTANAPPYEQSDLVKTFYSTNPQDGSQFSTPGLRTLFQTTNFAQTPPAVSDPSPTPSAVTSSSGSNTGAIAGGVVGGVVGAAFLAGLAFFLYRRRRHSYYKAGKGGNTPELQGNEHSLQEINGNGATKYYGSSNAIGYSEPQHQQISAEVEGTNPRQELGYDEAGGTEERPLEMEAREVKR